MLQRILALLVKELIGLWKDRKTRFVILIPPLIQVFIFAYAATYDVTNVPLGIWNEDRGPQAAELVRRFAGSKAFHPAAAISSPAEAAAAIDAQRATVILHLPQNFSARLLAGQSAKAQLLIDARRSNTALLAGGYASTIVAEMNEELGKGRTPLLILTRDWYNPTLESQWFILPGLVAVLSLMIAMLVCALSLARERELGTFEQLLVTPLRPAEILIGKALPGIVVGWIDATLVVIAALAWFHIPFLGDWALFEATLILYMATGSTIGLVISSVTRTQQQAMLGVFVIASPMVVLSGYAAPIENMPVLAEWTSRADPIRWMLVITRGSFLQHLPVTLIFQNALPLMIIGFVAAFGAWVAVRRAVS